MYDAYIYDPRSLTLMHVCMMQTWMMHMFLILVPDVCSMHKCSMHKCMMHMSIILVPDVRMMHECMMHISMILFPDPDACINV